MLLQWRFFVAIITLKKHRFLKRGQYRATTLYSPDLMQNLPFQPSSLAEHVIDIWLAYPDEITDVDLLLAYQALLTEQDRQQWQRFYFARHQQQYLVTRALVRAVLSQYWPLAPSAWQFVRDSYGKPEIQPGLIPLPLRFNLSHTEGLICCAVTLKHAIGVDVEYLLRANATLDIAARYFAAAEIQALTQLPDALQQQRFFALWTLKEAYIKARGLGLSLPLDQFSFSFDHQQSVSIEFLDAIADTPEHWQFWRYQPSEQHQMALAVNSAEPISVRVKKIVPLQHITALIE